MTYIETTVSYYSNFGYSTNTVTAFKTYIMKTVNCYLTALWVVIVMFLICMASCTKTIEPPIQHLQPKIAPDRMPDSMQVVKVIKH